MSEPHAYESQTETGFGTGLRAHLLGPADRRDGVLLEPDADAGQPAGAPAEELEGPSGVLEGALADLRAREERLSEREVALAAEEARLQEARSELEHAEAGVPVRDLLRARVQQQAERVWLSFEQALEATYPDGSPDFSTRLAAARALLAEAYGRPVSAPVGSAAAADREGLEDELARIRDRRLDRHVQ